MKKLTSKMMKVAEYSVANPEKTQDELAKFIGVDPSTVWRWTQDEKYQAYVHELCIRRFNGLEKLALLKLKENANNNNQKAIEYILDYMGYKSVDKVELDGSVDISVNIDED